MKNRIGELLDLNSEQQQLIDTENSYVVQAGAGSGKTRVLVSRYLQILESGAAGISQIVAITFTINAANEMKERIRKYVKEYICRYGESENINEDCLKDISDCPISTIHGFAAGIIRENPYECNINSRINILEGLDQKLFIDQTIDEYLSRKFGKNKNVTEIFENENYNYFAVRNRIKEILQLASRNHVYPSSEISGNDIKRQIELLVKTLSKEISNGPFGSKNKKIDLKIKEVNNALSGFVSSNTKHEKLTYLNQSKHILSNQNSPKGILELKVSSDIERHYAAGCSEIINQIINLYDLQNSNNYLKIFAKFYDFYRDKKRINGFLEFEDLLQIALQLLKNNPEILDEYKKKYKFFLIDEFQDTDKLQYELIDLFSDSANNFIVGDPKQSIFGFRGADPEIFKKLQKSHNTSVLSYNYRSDFRLIKFYNKIFGLIIKESYEKMNYISLNEKKDSVKEIICSEVTKADKRVFNESITVARKISMLLEQGYRKKDIAILLRSKSNMDYFENSLFQSSIEYYSSEKTGFYGYQEIRDIISFLKYITNENDKISEACVLRSTFLGASDTELFNHYAKKQSVELVDDYLEFISNLRSESLSLNPLELLNNILNKTCFWTAMLSLPGGKHKYESVTKLIEIFSKLQLQGKDLTEIIKFLDLNYEENTEGLSQLELDESDSVKILTVHKAKGLEFPVVILADINHGMGGGSETVGYSDKYGFLIRNQAVRSNIWKDMIEEQKQLTLEEEKRSLYVAMTRAKEKLIFSVCTNSKIQTGSYLEILNKVLPISNIEKGENSINFNNWNIPISYYEELTEPVPINRMPENEDMILEEEMLEINLINQNNNLTEEDLSFPELSIYLNNLQIGSIMHRFLQIWNFEEMSINSTINYVLNENYSVDNKMFDLLKTLSGNFLSSDLFQEINSADEIKRELPFYIELDGKSERRKIDLIIFKDGDISLFDYKLSKDIKEDYIEKMHLYESALIKKYSCNNISKNLVRIPEVIINNIN